jgi:hypothetical protein
MRFMSRLARAASETAACKNGQPQAASHYESVLSIDSSAAPGVRFTIHRVSFGRRMELSRRVRDLSRKAQFLEAGTELHEKIEANILAQEIDAMYLRWGLVTIEGLTIDGAPATTERLFEHGPEELVREVVSSIKIQCGLSEAERKNSSSHSIFNWGTRPLGAATSVEKAVWRKSGDADG